MADPDDRRRQWRQGASPHPKLANLPAFNTASDCPCRFSSSTANRRMGQGIGTRVVPPRRRRRRVGVGLWCCARYLLSTALLLTEIHLIRQHHRRGLEVKLTSRSAQNSR